MSAALPSESAVDSAVQEFGLGTYDSEGEGEHSHGEDSNEKVVGRSLPDGGGSEVPSTETFTSYPNESAIIAGLITKFAEALLPGDVGRPDGRGHGHGETVEDPVLTTSNSELPEDENNPAARSDYFDKTVVGQRAELWPDEDSGAYAGENVAESELPGVTKNETTMDDFLGALGNAWSGFEIEDVSGPQGFPAQDFSENADYPKSNDGTSGGRLVALTKVETMNSSEKFQHVLASYARGETTLGRLFDVLRGTDTAVFAATGRTAGEFIDRAGTIRKATDFAKVGSLAEGVLKEYGKKGLTKRHVLAFLQKAGEAQYLSSDVIRCLKHRHEVYVKDVLDEFPVAKLASSGISGVRDRVIALETENVLRPEVSSVLRRTAAALTTAIAAMERLEGRHG